MPAQLTLPRAALVAFCRRHPIRRLAVFGSVLRDDFTAQSDVDFLVEFEPDAGVGLFELFAMEEELATLLEGHRAELNTPASLSPYFRERVVAEAEDIYVKG
jgi:predicted nucleotidyltransferase